MAPTMEEAGARTRSSRTTWALNSGRKTKRGERHNGRKGLVYWVPQNRQFKRSKLQT